MSPHRYLTDVGPAVTSRPGPEAVPTVILSLQGGLGNQLFQWAAARAMQLDGAAVRVDTVRCRGDRPLAVGPLIERWQRVPYATGMVLVAAQRAGMLGRGPFPRLVAEPSFGYDEAFLQRARAGGYVRAYFQSPAYFGGAERVVAREAHQFLRSMLTAKGRALEESLRGDPSSVAVHVRRGDYVTDPSAAAKHGVLDSDYYARAFRRVAQDRPFGRRVWLSNDRSWVADNLAQPGDVMIDDSLTTSDGGEIALMAACSTRVVANSSFSWWAGYLGLRPEEGGLVIAPERWFAGRPGKASSLIPASWVSL